MANTVRMSSELVGQELGGRYKLEGKIGSGGFAIVYRAKDTRIGKYVAVKVLDREKVRSVRDIGRFRNEAAIAAAIDDEHIVKVTDYGEEEGRFYFVMELLRGHSLRQTLVLSERFPWRRACAIGLQICHALEQAHNHHIIHRDIKPENIFVETRRGGVEHVKLLDLGIAKVQHGGWDGLAQNLSHTGDFVGSPSYMSPEQAKGPRHCDHRVDIYALGVVLFELVTGDVPFRGTTAWETVLLHVEQPVPPMAKRAPGVEIPAGFEAIVVRALAKDPDKRYATVAEMAAALQALLTGVEVKPAEVAPGAPLGGALARVEVRMPGEVRASTEGLPPAAAQASEVGAAAETGDGRQAAETDADGPAPAAATHEESVDSELAAPSSAAPTRELPAAGRHAEPVTHRLPERPGARKREPVPAPAEAPSSVGPASLVHAPGLPLRLRTRLLLGYLMLGSMLAMCSIGTSLAMTIDPEWIDGIRRAREIRMLDRLPREEFVPPQLASKSAPVPSPAPAPTAEPESPLERLLLAPDDPPEVAAPEVKKRPARARKESVGELLEVPRKQTMASMARKAAVVVKEACKITPFSPLTEAQYDVSFRVHPTTGAIEGIDVVGEPPPLHRPDCVRDRAKAIIISFAGASDLRAEYRHSYAVIR